MAKGNNENEDERHSFLPYPGETDWIFCSSHWFCAGPLFVLPVHHQQQQKTSNMMPPKRTNNKKNKRGKKKESSNRDIHDWAETGRLDAKGLSKSLPGVANAIREGSMKPSEVPKMVEQANKNFIMEELMKHLPSDSKEAPIKQLYMAR